MITFTSLDGITAAPKDQSYLDYILKTGYNQPVLLKGTVGWSELGMHMGVQEVHGIVAFRAEFDKCCAHVMLEDGSFTSGCFTLFSDHRFSLS